MGEHGQKWARPSLDHGTLELSGSHKWCGGLNRLTEWVLNAGSEKLVFGLTR